MKNLKKYICSFLSCFADGEAKKESKVKSNSNDEKYIDFDDFLKMDLRVGTITKAEKLEGSDKLIKCTVDFGDLGKRTVVSGIYKYRKPEEIEGKQFLYIVNLKPRKIFGVNSEAMLLAASDDDGGFAMLTPDKEIKSGAKLS